MLGALALFAMMAFARPRVISVFFSPCWLLLLGFFMLSVLNAADPSAAARAAFFTLIGIVTIVAVLALPRDADSFSTVIAFAGSPSSVVSYVGLVLLPDVAIHTADSAEPEHAGLWRGVFAHKNIAGPVMACFSFAGLYLFRRGWSMARPVALRRRDDLHGQHRLQDDGRPGAAGDPDRRAAGPDRHAAADRRAVCAGGDRHGAGDARHRLHRPLKELANTYFPDLTYTGRTTLWEFAGEMLAKQPWTGYGYESFWGSTMLLNTDQPFDRPWDIRTIVHGHDGYLDIALVMGIPALCVAVFTFLIEPLRDYMRIPLLKENIFLGDFFMMIVLFTALNAFLESFFFRRADPVWLFFVLGLLGLRLVARFPVRSHSAG